MCSPILKTYIFMFITTYIFIKKLLSTISTVWFHESQLSDFPQNHYIIPLKIHQTKKLAKQNWKWKHIHTKRTQKAVVTGGGSRVTTMEVSFASAIVGVVRHLCGELVMLPFIALDGFRFLLVLWICVFLFCICCAAFAFVIDFFFFSSNM